MNATMLTMTEVQDKGLKVLARELGPADYVRFLQHYEVGHGDYTAERRKRVDKISLLEAIAMVEDQEQKK